MKKYISLVLSLVFTMMAVSFAVVLADRNDKTVETESTSYAQNEEIQENIGIGCSMSILDNA